MSLFGVGRGHQPVKHHVWWPCAAGQMPPSHFWFRCTAMTLFFKLRFVIGVTPADGICTRTIPLTSRVFLSDCSSRRHPPSTGVRQPQKWGQARRKVPAFISRVCWWFLHTAAVCLMGFALSLQSAQEISLPAEPSSGVQPVKWRSRPWVRLPR